MAEKLEYFKYNFVLEFLPVNNNLRDCINCIKNCHIKLLSILKNEMTYQCKLITGIKIKVDKLN